MLIYETLRKMLISHGITTEYSNDELDSFILEAKLLLDAPFVYDTLHEDYVDDFEGNKYMLRYYPFKESNEFSVSLNDEDITSHVKKIMKSGLLFFDKSFHGSLNVTYSVGLDVDDINTYIVPIVLYIIRDKEGKNISSINEGDISISYDNTSNSSLTTDALIKRLKNKYGTRLRLI